MPDHSRSFPTTSAPTSAGIVPALLGPGDWSTSLPAWFPEPVRHARQVVVLIVDGLGWDQFVEHRALMPSLAAMTGGPITTVAPTTTATALASIATGLTPGEHGLVGYRMLLQGDVLNVLRWASADSDRRRALPPAQVQPFAPFLGLRRPGHLPGRAGGDGVHRGPPARFAAGRLPGAVGDRRRGAPPARRRRAVRLRLLRQRRQDGPRARLRRVLRRRAAHGRPHRRHRPRRAAAGRGARSSPPTTVRSRSAIACSSPIRRCWRWSAMQSGEGRFRWWHADRASVDELAKAAIDAYGDVAWIVTREQVLDEHWFGPTVSGPVAARLGDVAVVAREPRQLPRSARRRGVPAGVSPRVADQRRGACAVAGVDGGRMNDRARMTDDD